MPAATQPDPKAPEEPTEDLDDLPPLPAELDEAGQVADYSDLLEDFDEPDDLDDESAVDLEVGIEVAGLTDDDEDADETLHVELGSLVAQPEPGSLEDGDEPEMATLNASWGIDDLEESFSEDAEGIDESVESLLSESPAEGVDAPDSDQQPDAAEGWLELDDDPEFTQPANSWPEVGALARNELAATALETESGLIVASNEVNPWGTEGPRVRLPNTATGLAETARGMLVATVAGELFLIERDRSAPSRLTTWREPAQCRSDELVQLDIWGAGRRGATVLARTSTGVLLRSEDGGAGWRRVDTRGRVLALDAQTKPAWLVQDETGLDVATGAGADRTTTPIRSGLPRLGRGRCTLSVSGPLVAVAEDQVGLYMSSDGGASFKRVPGCAGATAILALAEDDAVLAALTLAADERAALLRIGASDGRHELIASVDQRDEENEAVEITNLAYLPAARQVAAIGGFGVRVFKLPG